MYKKLTLVLFVFFLFFAAFSWNWYKNKVSCCVDSDFKYKEIEERGSLMFDYRRPPIYLKSSYSNENK